MKSTNLSEVTSTKIFNFANPESEPLGSKLRDEVLSVAGAIHNGCVVIARDTVTLYGYTKTSSATRALEQVTRACEGDCVVVAA